MAERRRGTPYPTPPPCEICGRPTTALAAAIARECDPCHEVTIRLEAFLRRGGEKANAFVRGALARTEDPGADLVD